MSAPLLRGGRGRPYNAESGSSYIALYVLNGLLGIAITTIAIWAFVKTWQNSSKSSANMMDIMELNATLISDTVEGPFNATDGAVARFDGDTGELLQNSVVILDDTGTFLNVGGIVSQVETVSGDGAGKDAMDVDVMTTLLDTSGGTSDLTLATATEGQIKIITMTVAGNAATLDNTDGNLSSAITITFDAVGESAVLVYTSVGWSIVGIYGATVA